MTLSRIILGILVAGGISSLGFMLYAGNPATWWWWLIAIPFAGWVLAPYALVAAMMTLKPTTRGSQVVLCLAAIALSLFGIAVLYSAFFLYQDPQSGIVLFLLPIWQLVGLVPFLFVSRFLARRGAAA